MIYGFPATPPSARAADTNIEPRPLVRRSARDLDRATAAYEDALLCFSWTVSVVTAEGT